MFRKSSSQQHQNSSTAQPETTFHPSLTGMTVTSGHSACCLSVLVAELRWSALSVVLVTYRVFLVLRYVRCRSQSPQLTVEDTLFRIGRVAFVCVWFLGTMQLTWYNCRSSGMGPRVSQHCVQSTMLSIWLAASLEASMGGDSAQCGELACKLEDRKLPILFFQTGKKTNPTVTTVDNKYLAFPFLSYLFRI